MKEKNRNGGESVSHARFPSEFLDAAIPFIENESWNHETTVQKSVILEMVVILKTVMCALFASAFHLM